MQDILEEMKTYIESAEVTIDGEWGSCRSLEDLIAEDLMPDLYKKIIAALGDENAE